MELRQYLNSMSAHEQVDFAKRCETSVGYLRKALSINQLLGPALCVSIERESYRSVTRQELRPNDWQSLWPELVEAA